MRLLSNKGYDLIKSFEGLELKPYLCPAGKPTIGYGMTFYPNGKKVTMKDTPLTEKQASDMLKQIADKFARDVDSLVKSKIDQNQFDALVSFAYNVGSDIDSDTIAEGLGDSTLLKKVNKDPNDKAIAAQFLEWNKSSGKVSPGLVNRRKKESELYFTK
jgi:lysozyme